MPKYNPSIHNVKIQTWGTKNKKSNGLDNFVDQELFGGNVGHASIVMSLPINSEIKKWIEEYCYEQTFEEFKQEKYEQNKQENVTFEQYLNEAEQIIPTTLKKDTTYLAKYDENGKLEKSEEEAFEIEYFQIEFSWWPTTDDTIGLSNTKLDMTFERHAKHFEYSEKAKEFLQPEERIHKGKLGAKQMTYAPSLIVHQRDLSDTQINIVDIKLQLTKIEEHLEAKELLISKVNGLKTLEIEGSLKLIGKNIGLDSNQIKNDYLQRNTGEIDIDEFKNFFKSEVKSHMKKLKAQKQQLEKKLINEELKEVKIEGSLQLVSEKLGLERDELVAKLVDKYSESTEEQSIEGLIKFFQEEIKNYIKDFNLEKELIKEQLKEVEIEQSLKLVGERWGLARDELVDKLVDEYSESTKEQSIEGFIKFFQEKIKDLIEDLNDEKEKIEEDKKEKIEEDIEIFTEVLKNVVVEKKKQMDMERDYLIRGVPPDNTVTLPYLDEGRGLSPEAMLKKMRELTEPDAPGFDLHTNNCSKTTTEILTAGAEHDPLLKDILSKQALGFFGTPQQVLGNAQNARDVIVNNKENTLLTKIGNINFLDKAAGKLISVFMDQDSSGLQKGMAVAGLVPIALAKLPGTITRALLNPTETIENIISGVSTVNKHANSALLKGVVGFLSVIPLIVLAPFALIEQGIKLVAKPFQALAKWLSKKELPEPLEGQITTPLPSENSHNTKDSSYHSMMAGLVNDKVVTKVKGQTKELTSQEKTPLEILEDFENELRHTRDIPDEKVITLSDKSLDKINKYIREENDSEVIERFKKCCEESLSRANKLSPKTPEEVDRLIEEELIVEKNRNNYQI